MSLSSLTSLMESSCKMNEGKGDYFDLLGLPDEIIDQIFSYLPIEDRMRVRMNKRLAKIVEDLKYYKGAVFLYQLADGSQCVSFDNRSSSTGKTTFPFDVIRRIAHNTSTGVLNITFPRPDPQLEIAHKFCNIIKEFRSIGEIVLDAQDGEKFNEIVTESFFLDLSRRCESLYLYGRTSDGNHISTEILHNAYKGMKDGSVSARFVHFSGIKNENYDAFLNSLGVVYRYGQVISNRSIEAYKEYSRDKYCLHIFDGFVQITCIYEWFEDEDQAYWKPNHIEIEVHKNEEALISAKMIPCCNSTRVRLDVYSE